MLSTYQFASNTPIQAIDLDGKEAWVAYIEHYNNSKTPKIHLEFDVDLKNIQVIYEVHRFYDKDNKVEGITTGSTSFSDPKYSDKFPNNGKLSRDDGKPLITFDGYGQIIYGEVAFAPNKYTNASFGLNGVAAGFSFSTGGKKKIETELLDGSNPEWNMGLGLNIGGAGFEARKKYFPARGKWGEVGVEGELTNSLSNSKIKSNIGIKADGQSQSLKIGIPEGKISWGLGLKGGAYFSINKQLNLSHYEMILKRALEKTNYHVKNDTPDINAHKQN